MAVMALSHQPFIEQMFFHGSLQGPAFYILGMPSPAPN